MIARAIVRCGKAIVYLAECEDARKHDHKQFEIRIIAAAAAPSLGQESARVCRCAMIARAIVGCAPRAAGQTCQSRGSSADGASPGRCEERFKTRGFAEIYSRCPPPNR